VSPNRKQKIRNGRKEKEKEGEGSKVASTGAETDLGKLGRKRGRNKKNNVPGGL